MKVSEWTPETIKCRPIDTEKMEGAIVEWRKPKDGESYKMGCSLAIIETPRLAIIDDEFVGSDIDGNEVSFSVWVEGVGDDGLRWGSCFPEFSVALTIEELEQYLLPEITLAEHTKNRRGYNSRIRCNEAEWMREFNR